LSAPKSIPLVEVEILDHHFVKMTTVQAKNLTGQVDLKLPKTKSPVESLRIRIGDFVGRVDLSLQGVLDHSFGESANSRNEGDN
jgi:hypothetical protein